MDFPTVTLEWIIFCCEKWWQREVVPTPFGKATLFSGWELINFQWVVDVQIENVSFLFSRPKEIIQRNADKLLLKESHGMFLSDGAVHFLRFLFTIHVGQVTPGGCNRHPLMILGILVFSGRFFPLSHRSPFISPQKRHSKLRIWCSWLVQ